MNKKIIKYLVLLLFLMIIFFIIFTLIRKDNNLLKKKIKIGDITFSKVMIYQKDDNYVFKVNMKSNKNLNIESIDIYLKNQNGELITILSSYVGSLKKGESKKIIIDSAIDILGAYSVNYTVNKE